MRKILFAAVAIAYLALMAGCAGRNSAAASRGAAEGHTHTESCEGSHDGHDHSHENHDPHDHDPHDHSHDGHDHGHEAHDHAEHGHAEHIHGPECQKPAVDTHAELEGEIIFPAAQAARVDLRVETAELSPFRDVILVSGDIGPAQGDAHTVVAPVAGIVSFPQSRVAPGMEVSKGDVLFYVSSKSVAGGDAAAKAKAAYESAKAAFERAETLLPDRIVSQKEYDDARREYLDAKNEWEALSAGSTDKGSAVRAPVSGYVSSLSVAEGEFAEVGQPLAVVARNARQQLVARVPERYYSALPKIRSANVIAPDGTVVALDDRNGKLLSVGRSLEAGATLVPVTFEFDAHPSVIAGSTVEVRLLGAERQNVLAVPLGALTESQGLYFVYEQVDEEGYLKHEVVPGASDGQRVEILAGLEPGLRIVTKGAVHVKMATSSAIPHSHQH